MKIRQKVSDSSAPLYFILWSNEYPLGLDRDSPGGWGKVPDYVSYLYSFKLDIIL